MVSKIIRIKNNCWCGSGRAYSDCHGKYDDAIKAAARLRRPVPTRKILKTNEQLDGIRRSAAVNMAVLDYVSENIAEGISTLEIDRLVYEKTKEHHAIPAPLNYEGFPKSVCVSVNNEVCHGIPDKKTILKSGDIVNVDASTILDGYYSDSSRMFCIGDVSPENRRLVDAALECVHKGLEKVRPLGHLGDVGQAVNDCARSYGYSVVREMGGHVRGLEFHEDPWVSYVSKKGTGMLLVPGMVFTIEPMVNMGTARIYTDKRNGWTVYTADGKPSAQWEYMVLVTEDGYEVISK